MPHTTPTPSAVVPTISPESLTATGTQVRVPGGDMSTCQLLSGTSTENGADGGLVPALFFAVTVTV